eukprot:snap_masked-scaffold_23-processed-gene-2.32-mRNA-1 protein AED:1.00 eAED:1.00 QI:0/-1/0/0/-1/1/1/0/63
MDEKSASFLNIILLCKSEKSGITLENAQNEHWIDYFSNNTIEGNLFERFFLKIIAIELKTQFE